VSLKLENLVKAIEEAKKAAKPRRFIQSYELIIKLKDVDTKQPENRFSELVVLPHPPARKLSKVAVIADGDMALKAREAGADLVITREELEKIAGSKKEAKKIAKSFDAFLAQADLMPIVGRLIGRYLGPRGKMPQPVLPSVDLKALIDRVKKSVRVRLRDQPLIMCRVGTEDQSPKEVAENTMAVLNFVLSKFKMQNIDRVYLKLTMGPPVRVV